MNRKVYLGGSTESFVWLDLLNGHQLRDFKFELSPALDAALLFAPVKTRLKVVQKPGRQLLMEYHSGVDVNALHHPHAAMKSEPTRQVLTDGVLFFAMAQPSGEELLGCDIPLEWTEEDLAVRVSTYLQALSAQGGPLNLPRNPPAFNTGWRPYHARRPI